MRQEIGSRRPYETGGDPHSYAGRGERPALKRWLELKINGKDVVNVTA